MKKSFPNIRMRRLRSTSGIRKLVRETNLCSSDLIQPIFITEGKNRIQKISSMPGIYRFSIDMAIKEIRALTKDGIGAIALFPQIEKRKKSNQADEAYNDDGLIQYTADTTTNELTVDADIMVLANPEIAQLPNWVIALLAAGALAAALSTAAGLLLVISSAVSHDLLKKMVMPNISEKDFKIKKTMTFQRWNMPICANNS